MCESAKGNQILWIALRVIEHNKDFRVGDLIHHAVIGVSWIIWILYWRRDETLFSLCILTNQDPTIIHVPLTTRVGWWVGWPSWVWGVLSKIHAISVHGCWKVKESFKIRLLQGFVTQQFWFSTCKPNWPPSYRALVLRELNGNSGQLRLRSLLINSENK